MYGFAQTGGRVLTSGKDGSEAQSEAEEGSAGGQEESQSRQEPRRPSHTRRPRLEDCCAPKAPARAQKPPRPGRRRTPRRPPAAAARQAWQKAQRRLPSRGAKQALELLEAKVAAGQGEGRRAAAARGGKDAWLIPPEMPKEDAETRRTRLKNLIKLGKERGFLTYSEINDHLPDDLVDAEQIEAIISTFGDMGIQVYDQAPDQERCSSPPTRSRWRRPTRTSRSRPKPRCRRSTPSSAAPPTRCACTCARWARSSCSRARARSRSPSASRTACAT